MPYHAQRAGGVKAKRKRRHSPELAAYAQRIGELHQPMDDTQADIAHFVPVGLEVPILDDQTVDLDTSTTATNADVSQDMSQRAEAEQQAPAHLKAPRIRRSRRMTWDGRVPIGQASADTGRGTKRHAAQCDETADAPQPKRQHGEPKEPDCQQASEEAPTPPISAAPAPAVTEAPAAARDPSANLRDETVADTAHLLPAEEPILDAQAAEPDASTAATNATVVCEDMPQRAKAEQQAPAHLKAPRIRRSRRMTWDGRVPIGQASADTGRGTKRHAAQCDETADAPQPKRRRDEPKQPDCQQASEEAPIPPISAAPAPVVMEAPAAASNPSADLRDETVADTAHLLPAGHEEPIPDAQAAEPDASTAATNAAASEDMPKKAVAEQQGPASLQGPRIKRSRRMTRDRRVPSGQVSADTGRGTKRHAAQGDETADAPQPKRQRGEPKQPDFQQAREEAPIPPISAAPAPIVTEAPAAARDPSADLRDETVADTAHLLPAGHEEPILDAPAAEPDASTAATNAAVCEDMPQRAKAEQQGPAPLQGPMIKRSRRMTRDRRGPSGQVSADTGRGTKRHAAQGDETDDAPQPKRQRGEPNEPDSQQASEEAPTPGDSAAPAPAAAEAPAAASNSSPSSTDLTEADVAHTIPAGHEGDILYAQATDHNASAADTNAAVSEDMPHRASPEQQELQKPNLNTASPEEARRYMLDKLHHESGRDLRAWRQRVPWKMRKSRLHVETRLSDSPDVPSQVRIWAGIKERLLRKNNGVAPVPGNKYFKKYSLACAKCSDYIRA